MPVARLNVRTTTRPYQVAGYASAEIVSHPQRGYGAIRKKQALELQLLRQKRAAVTKIEQVIAGFGAMRSEDNAHDLDWSINELQLVLDDIQQIDILQVSNPNLFAQFALRVQIAHVAAISGNCTAKLNNVVKSVDKKPRQ